MGAWAWAASWPGLPSTMRAHGLVVMPFCPFIAAYIERHLDEYGDLVAPEMLMGDRDHETQNPPADREELAISDARA